MSNPQFVKKGLHITLLWYLCSLEALRNMHAASGRSAVQFPRLAAAQNACHVSRRQSEQPSGAWPFSQVEDQDGKWNWEIGCKVMSDGFEYGMESGTQVQL